MPSVWVVGGALSLLLIDSTRTYWLALRTVLETDCGTKMSFFLVAFSERNHGIQCGKQKQSFHWIPHFFNRGSHGSRLHGVWRYHGGRYRQKQWKVCAVYSKCVQVFAIVSHLLSDSITKIKLLLTGGVCTRVGLHQVWTLGPCYSLTNQGLLSWFHPFHSSWLLLRNTATIPSPGDWLAQCKKFHSTSSTARFSSTGTVAWDRLESEHSSPKMPAQLKMANWSHLIDMLFTFQSFRLSKTGESSWENTTADIRATDTPTSPTHILDTGLTMVNVLQWQFVHTFSRLTKESSFKFQSDGTHLFRCASTGAFYYYNTEKSKTYEATMVDVAQLIKTSKLPFR